MSGLQPRHKPATNVAEKSSTMAHLITSSDRVGIVGSTGWHNLGEEIPAGMSAFDAIRHIGLNWEIVESSTLIATMPDGRVVDCSTEKKALVRSDTGMVTGVVGKGYHALQQTTLASLADGLASGENAPSVDSLGSIEGGKKVWISLRGESTTIGGDEAYQYCLIANSHDGSGSLRIHPSMTRVVCANTYAGSESDSHLGFSWKHSSGLQLKREEIIATLANWRSRLAEAKSDADRLAEIEVTHDRCQTLWLEVYERLHGYSVPVLPTTPVETRRKERAVVALAEMAKVFDLERQGGCKPTLWLASQSATNWIQHTSGRLESQDRVMSQRFGLKAQQTALAMSIVTASV